MIRRSTWQTLTAFVLAGAFPMAALAGDTGAIKGKIKLEGKAKRTVIQMTADPNCVKANTKEDGTPKKVGSENVIAKDGMLQNVIVYVKEGLGDKKFEADASKTFTIDQHGCMYTPHVFTMQTGQGIIVINSDATLHNIHGLPQKNAEFNFGQPQQGMKSEPLVMKQAEIFKVKCDVHPWMSAYVGVFDHPFHAVTGADGLFELKDLPKGDYTIAAWHEELGEQIQKVSVTGEPTDIEFTFKVEAAGGEGN